VISSIETDKQILLNALIVSNQKSRKGGKTNPKTSSSPILPHGDSIASGQWLETLAAISPAAIYRTDPDGHCVWVNAKWSDHTGRPEEAAIGEGWRKAVHPEDLARLDKEWWRAAHRREPYVGEYRYIRPDGSVCWVLSRTTAQTDSRGRVIGYIGVCVDITQLRDAHEAIKNADPELTTDLTTREREVAVLLAEGRSNKQVASRLDISVRTAEAHRARIMRKLRVGSLAGLVKYAIKHRLIEA